MSSKMYALTIKETGHVLAVATAMGAPEETPPVEALAGGAFPFRYGDVAFPVPADRLGVAEVAVDPNLLVNPAGFRVDENGDTRPVPTTPKATVEATATETALTIKAPGAEKLTAVVLVAHHPNGPVGPFTLTIGKGDSGAIALTTPQGKSFDCLVAAPGLSILVTKVGP